MKTESERVRVHSGYWDDIDNRRKFLFDFAAKMNFDPMKEINWKGMATKIQASGVTLYILIVSILDYKKLMISIKGKRLAATLWMFHETDSC